MKRWFLFLGACVWTGSGVTSWNGRGPRARASI